MIDTVNEIEVLWIIICLCGLIPQLIILFKFVAAHIYLVRHGINGDRKLAARERIRVAITFIGVIGIFLFFGIMAAFLPNSTEQPTLQAKIFTLCLFAANVGMVVSGIFALIAINKFEHSDHIAVPGRILKSEDDEKELEHEHDT